MRKIVRRFIKGHSADFVMLNVLHILNDGYRASILLLLPFIAVDLHFDLTSVGVLGSVMNSLGILLALPAGYLARRAGGMRVLTIALLLYGLGFLFTGVSTQYYFFLATFMLIGAGFGIFHPVGFALVAKWSDKSERGRQMGNFSASGEIGKISIAAVITIIVTYIGWQYTAFLYAAAAIGIALYFYHYITTRKNDDTVKEKQNEPIQFSFLLKQKQFLLTLASTFFDVIASNSIFLFLPFLLLAKGVESSWIGLYAAAFFIGNFGGKTLIGRFVDSYGSKKVFIGSELCMALIIVAILLLQQPLLVLIACTFLGAFTLGTVPAIQTMISETEVHGNYEKSYAVNSFVGSIGTTIGPLILGIISDNFAISIAFYVMAVCAVAATIPAIALWISTKRN